MNWVTFNTKRKRYSVPNIELGKGNVYFAYNFFSIFFRFEYLMSFIPSFIKKSLI